MKTVAIAGVGLIGGSFALAIRKAGFNGSILGVSSPATISEALSLGVIDEGVPLAEACRRADLVYLAQPILRILSMMPEMAPHLRSGCLVTDAGSTKSAICAAAASSLPPGMFLGGHPMAGKETRGVAASDPDLFIGRPYVLTPSPAGSLEHPVARELVQLIDAIGSRLVVLDPEQHDSVVAHTSHLPQLLSSCLASTLSSVEKSSEVVGPSVIDLTRLALSPYDMWHDIFATNQPAILQALDLFRDKLQQVRNDLTGDTTRQLFEDAFITARKIRRNQ